MEGAHAEWTVLVSGVAHKVRAATPAVGVIDHAHLTGCGPAAGTGDIVDLASELTDFDAATYQAHVDVVAFSGAVGGAERSLVSGRPADRGGSKW